MSRREPVVEGPIRARDSDIEEINRVFSDAFTDRYHRDGMSGVRVPLLNPSIWRYAIAAAADGALIWRDAARGLAGFNLAHQSGREGWMGPLAVRPDCQGRGLGRTIVVAAVDLLKAKGCRVIGLETMPRTIENIGFYSGLGFRPGHLTVTLAKDLSRLGSERIESGSSPRPAATVAAECAALAGGISPVADFSREIGLTIDQRLGDVSLVRRREGLVGFGLWHTVPLGVGRVNEELRILKLAAIDLGAFRDVVRLICREAAARGLRKVAVRCQTRFRDAYRELIDLGFRVHWTDLRMTLEGYEEPAIENGSVLFSNWEI